MMSKLHKTFHYLPIIIHFRCSFWSVHECIWFPSMVCILERLSIPIAIH